MKPRLYVMIGISGSGKTTWAKELIHKKKNTKIVNLDDLNYEYNSLEENFEIGCLIVNYFLSKGHDVIFDATNLTELSRLFFLKHIKEEYKVVYIHTRVPLRVALQRNELRKENKVPTARILEQWKILDDDKKSWAESKDVYVTIDT